MIRHPHDIAIATELVMWLLVAALIFVTLVALIRWAL